MQKYTLLFQLSTVVLSYLNILPKKGGFFECKKWILNFKEFYPDWYRICLLYFITSTHETENNNTGQ
jgi:hypothetical protein